MATKAYILIKVKAGRTKDVLQALKRLYRRRTSPLLLRTAGYYSVHQCRGRTSPLGCGDHKDSPSRRGGGNRYTHRRRCLAAYPTLPAINAGRLGLRLRKGLSFTRPEPRPHLLSGAAVCSRNERDGDGGPAKFCRTVAGVGHLDGATSITPGDRRLGVRFDGMDEGAECGENCLLRLDDPFMRSGVTDDAAHSLVTPISGDLPLGSHPLRSRNPPRYDTCNVQDASHAAHGLGLHDRHRVRCHARKLVQLATDGDHLLAGEKGHQIQEVNPKFQERSALAWYR